MLITCYKIKEIERQDKEMWEWNDIWTFWSDHPHNTVLILIKIYTTMKLKATIYRPSKSVT